MSEAANSRGPDTPRRATYREVQLEALRRKIERNRRLFEEHEQRTPERDRELAELLAKKFMREGRL